MEDPNILGSMEFATKVKGTKLIVVMGHNHCGAVKGAVDDAELGQDKVLNEGLHFKIPIMQQVVLMDVRVQKAQTDASSSSSDLQDVTLSVALIKIQQHN